MLDMDKSGLSTITLSGRTYLDAIDDSGVPVEEGWPTPTVGKRGRGRTYTYSDLTAAQRFAILSHLADVLDTRNGYDGAAGEAAPIRRDLARNGWTE